MELLPAPNPYLIPHRRSTESTLQLSAIDFETPLIQPGLLAPPIILGSRTFYAGGRRQAQLLATPEQALDGLEEMLRDPNTLIAGANIAYDLGCACAADSDRFIPLIIAAFDEGRIYDVQIAQALDAIAGGHLFLDPHTYQKMVNPATGKQSNRYSLDIVTYLMTGRVDAKRNDYWRTRYAILAKVPFHLWPESAKQYPIDDVINAADVADEQRKRPLRNLQNMSEQAETAFWLHMGAVWGIRTDKARVAALRAKNEAEREIFNKRYKALGFIRTEGAKAGSEDQAAVKKAVAVAYGASGTCPRCDGTGKILSPKSGQPIICKDAKEELPQEMHKRAVKSAFDFANKWGLLGCDGSGMDLSTAPMIPRSDGGGISCNRDSLMESGVDDLHDYGENYAEKILDTYVPWLEEGVDRPMNLSPNVLLASYRASYDGLIQLVMRSGGVRECFVARPYHLFCSVDYAALELCTLAQTLLWIVGWSKMADKINETKDPGALHTALAGSLVGKTFEEMSALIKAKDPRAKGWRTSAKAANFGFPGGMGSVTLVLSKRKISEGTTTAPDGTVYAGIRFCILLADAERCGTEKITSFKGRTHPPACKQCVEVVERVLRPAWFAQYPEMQEYFSWVSATVDAAGEIPLFVPGDFMPDGFHHMRGGVGFCDGANNGFQGLAAIGAKYALRQVARECYTDRSSPLWGTRPIFFAHDEVFTEMPKYKAHVAGPRKAQVMVEAMRRLVPDVHIEAKPALMYNWSKDAEDVYDENKKLIPWEDRRKSA